ncbi:MAG: hypothetical protein JOZ46_02390, partial [Candidatus Dormibacteraeota bacterium]|nr:hypothetical protein [Candidatus Dormibacteraeota bacterium]
LQGRLDQRRSGQRVLSGDQLSRFEGSVQVLTDDHAPVDQLLTVSQR